LRSELPEVLLGHKESKIGPCGGVDSLQNRKKKLLIEEELVMWKHWPPPLLREKLTGLHWVSLGTSAHNEGVVAVVGE
jgi:hypothetical protein